MSEKEPDFLSRKSPFRDREAIVQELTADFERIRVDGKSLQSNIIEDKINELCSWLCETPDSIVYRVNTNVTNADKICHIINKQFKVPPRIRRSLKIPEMIIVDKWDDSVELDLEIYPNHVIVDAACGSAVLRGAHVFAPGILSISRDLQVGSKVSVFADSSGNCRKGAKIYEDTGKIFLGNGIMRKSRREVFEHGSSGIGVYMTATYSRLPQLGDQSEMKGHAILQNLPSIICSRILDPQPGERVLDMCAAPGNKTTHISALMKGEGKLIALEKLKSKIDRIRNNCQVFSCKNVEIYCFDATKAVREDENVEKSDTNAPPFTKESFDRILLDGPCSALGQRPQIVNKMTRKIMKSHPSLQRKLFTTAVKLLKIGGILVYSTCTITIAENEGIVAWALKNFPELELSSPWDKFESMCLDKKYCGSPGSSVEGLNEDESRNLLKFGPESNTIGFFIAKFVKTNYNTINR